MPKKEIDYSKSVIYYAYNDDELLYIGSTTNFRVRKSLHESRITKDNPYKSPFHRGCNEKEINFLNIRWECELFPCENKYELERKEGILIRELKPTYNYDKNLGLSQKERSHDYHIRTYEKNKEKIIERVKNYREENKELIKERELKHREENKVEIATRHKEYRKNNIEAIKQREKQYREANKEKLKLKNKKYKEENKEKIALQLKKYREENKERLALQEKEYRQRKKQEKNKKTIEEEPCLPVVVK